MVKFRAWHKLMNFHFNVDAIDFSGGTIRKGEPCVIDDKQNGGCYLLKNCVLEQCTEVSADKSYRGTSPEDLLIYEGDVLIYSSEKVPHPVVVRRTKPSEDNHPGFRIVDLWGQYGKIEIIGNIHTVNVVRGEGGYMVIEEE